jgi:hypothetical protein
MADLYPTKTRLALLAAVRAGHVLDLPDEDSQEIPTWDTSGAEDGEPARRVTARVTELCRAGWITLSADGMTWRLTDEGRTVLDSHGGVRAGGEVIPRTGSTTPQ